jgi:hypothetical protein
MSSFWMLSLPIKALKRISLGELIQRQPSASAFHEMLMHAFQCSSPLCPSLIQQPIRGAEEKWLIII